MVFDCILVAFDCIWVAFNCTPTLFDDVWMAFGWRLICFTLPSLYLNVQHAWWRFAESRRLFHGILMVFRWLLVRLDFIVACMWFYADLFWWCWYHRRPVAGSAYSVAAGEAQSVANRIDGARPKLSWDGTEPMGWNQANHAHSTHTTNKAV